MMYDLVLKHCFYTLGNKLLVLYSTDLIILLKVPVSEADKYLRTGKLLYYYNPHYKISGGLLSGISSKFLKTVLLFLLVSLDSN